MTQHMKKMIAKKNAAMEQQERSLCRYEAIPNGTLVEDETGHRGRVIESIPCRASALSKEYDAYDYYVRFVNIGPRWISFDAISVIY